MNQVNINFPYEGGHSAFTYTVGQCSGSKTVTFSAQDDYSAWLTSAVTTNSIAFTAITQGSSTTTRTAKINVKVGDGDFCANYISIEQAGGLPCDCDSFRPIDFPNKLIGPDGAAVGTVIGTFNKDNLPQSCQSGTLTATCVSGSSSIPLTIDRTNGQIKLGAAISSLGYLDEGKEWDVTFKFNGTTCDSGKLYQTKRPCDCEHVSEILVLRQVTMGLAEQNGVLIATADKSCGVFSAKCDSNMLSTSITVDGNTEICPSKVRIIEDNDGTRAYIHVTNATQYRTCQITPMLKIKGTSTYTQCNDNTIKITQTGDYIDCDDIPNNICPRTINEYYYCAGNGNGGTYAEPYVSDDSGTYINYINMNYSKYAYSDSTDVVFVPRVVSVKEITNNDDWDIIWNSRTYTFCGVIYNDSGTELSNPERYASASTPMEMENVRIDLFTPAFQGNVKIISWVVDVYSFGTFCKTSTCNLTPVLAIPKGKCTSCMRGPYWREENCDHDYTESYKAFSKHIYTYDTNDFFCDVCVTAINVYIIGSYQHDFSSYIHISNIEYYEGTNCIKEYDLNVDENDTNEEFKYEISYTVVNETTREVCGYVSARCRRKEINVCGDCEAFRDKYLKTDGNDGEYNHGEICYCDDSCYQEQWVHGKEPTLVKFTDDPCDGRYELYFKIYDGSNNEITTSTAIFTNQNGKQVKWDASRGNYTYVSGRGWKLRDSWISQYCLMGWYDGTPGWSSSGGHPGDCGYRYRVVLWDTVSNTSCETPIYRIEDKYGLGDCGTSCDNPTCTKYLPSCNVNLLDGVPTIERTGKIEVLFPATGATMRTHFIVGFYAGETATTRGGWCDGYELRVEASSTFTANIHPRLVYDGRYHYTVVEITVDPTSNTEKVDYSADIVFKLKKPDGTESTCSNLAFTIDICQNGTNN